jgi:hypothetical protein
LATRVRAKGQGDDADWLALIQEDDNMNFSEFMNTNEGQRDLDPKLVKRLQDWQDPIDSKHALITFAKERWPDNYTRDWRKSTKGMPFGREAMEALWARYLATQESAG